MIQEKCMTPVGTASFPHINQADEFMNKRTYNVKLRLSKDDTETQAFIANVQKIVDKAIAHHKEDLNAQLEETTQPKKKQGLQKMLKQLEEREDFRVPYVDEYDRETGEETGNILVQVKNNESYTKKDGTVVDLQPYCYDAKGKRIAKADLPLITGGAKLKIQLVLKSYCAGGSIGAGLSCNFGGVQIVSLAGDFGGGGDSDFGAVEGGTYEATTAPKAQTLTEEVEDEFESGDY
jgi:hypothetical protein